MIRYGSRSQCSLYNGKADIFFKFLPLNLYSPIFDTLQDDQYQLKW